MDRKMLFFSDNKYSKEIPVVWGARQWRTQELFRGGGWGGSTNSVEGRENGDLRAAAL